MLCFAFLGAPGARIQLCEEVIRFSAYRNDGVHIGATVIVSLGDSGDRYLYAIHRRLLDGVCLTSPAEWAGNQQGFPLSHIFSTIIPARLAPQGNGIYSVRLGPLGNVEDTLQAVRAIGKTVDNAFDITDHIPVREEARDHVPYTCLRIEPLPIVQTKKRLVIDSLTFPRLL